MWKFTSLEANTSGPQRETFAEAFEDMFIYVNRLVVENKLAFQVLETAIWLDTPSGNPMSFYAARDFACLSGLMDQLKKKYP